MINNLACGGAENLLTQLVPLQQNEGLHIEVLLLEDVGNVFQIDEAKVMSINKGLYSPLNIKVLRSYMKMDFDVIHAHLFPVQYWIVFASLFLKNRPKLIFTEHCTSNRRWSNPFFRPIEKFIYRRYDVILAITDSVNDALHNWVRSSHVKSVVINNGVDIEKFNNAASYSKESVDTSIQKGDVLLMMVARFSSAKDHSTLLYSLKKLDISYKLLLVGDGEERHSIQKLSVDLGLQNRIIFLGNRNDVPSLMKSVDIIIQSSKWEGLSGVTLEAMASGTVFIGSDIKGISEVVNNPNALFKQGDVQGLVKLIQRIQDDVSYAKNIQLHAMDRVTEFSLEKMVLKYNALYEKLLEV